jgi:Pro-kumamolisin, activation domain
MLVTAYGVHGWDDKQMSRHRIGELPSAEGNAMPVVLEHLLQLACAIGVLLPALAGAQPLQQLHGHVPKAVAALTAMGPVADSTPIDVVIGLPPRNAESLTAALHDIYDPASSRFRQYLTPEQYNEQYAPSPESFQALLDFAKANDLAVVAAPPNHKFIHVRAPAAAMNKAFHVTLQQYKHPTEDRMFYAPATEPAMKLAVPVLQVSGLDNFRVPFRLPPQPKLMAPAHGAPPHAGGSGSGGAYTGGDFRAAYVPGVTLTGAGQVVGVLELSGYKESDITTYETMNKLPNVPLQNVYLNGYDGSNPNLESTADIELTISMAPGLSSVTVYGAPYNGAGVHDLLNEMANPSKGEPLPSQMSTSYYFFYDQNVYDSLKQLAVQGQALFVASGDFGSYNETSGSGAFPPADHPLATSVGATDLEVTGPAGAWKSETTAGFSGGGYSPWGADPQFALPFWQSGMSFSTFGGSSTVRNAPDVAMVGTNISVYYDGNSAGFAGTSASAPLWAGFMALVNEQAANSGRPRIGFANPALYAVARGGSCPSCFHDITTGNNFNSTNPDKYKAVAGFDLCTGWGTPNGSALINALVDLNAGWAQVPGGGTTNQPDAVTTFRDRVYLFGIGINDHHHYVNTFDGSAWSGWSAVPGGGTTLLADAVTVFQDRLYLFGIGINDHQHYVNTFDGSAWSGWSGVPGGGTTMLPDAATVFQSRLYLFGIGINDHHHYVNTFDGSAWSGWSAVPGGGTTTVSDAATVFQNHLYIFGIGINDHHHYVNTFDGSAWSGWSAVPGGGTTLLADAAAVFQERLYLFGIGINDHHHYLNTFNGSAWSGWSALPGGGKTALPDAAAVLQNRLYLFAIGTNDHHHYMMRVAP